MAPLLRKEDPGADGHHVAGLEHLAIVELARFGEVAHECLDYDGVVGVDAACADDETLLTASDPCGQLGTAESDSPRAGS